MQEFLLSVKSPAGSSASTQSAAAVTIVTVTAAWAGQGQIWPASALCPQALAPYRACAPRADRGRGPSLARLGVREDVRFGCRWARAPLLGLLPTSRTVLLVLLRLLEPSQGGNPPCQASRQNEEGKDFCYSPEHTVGSQRVLTSVSCAPYIILLMTGIQAAWGFAGNSENSATENKMCRSSPLCTFKCTFKLLRLLWTHWQNL